MKNSILSNEKGISLISVLVAIALTGVLTMIIMENMKLQSKSTKTIEWQNQVNDLKRQFSDFVSRPEPCMLSFTSATPGDLIPDLVLRPGKKYADVGQEFQSTGIIIKELSLLSLKEQKDRNLHLTSPDKDTGVSWSYLKVMAEKKKNQDGTSTVFGGGQTTFIVDILARFSLETTPGIGSTENMALKNFIDKAKSERTTVQGKMSAISLTTPGDVDFVRPVGFASLEAMESAGVAGVKDYLNRNPNTEGGFLEVIVPGASSQFNLIWPLIHASYAISDCGSHLSR